MDEPQRITAIRSRRGSKRRTVELDGVAWLSVPSAVLTLLAIGPGDLIDTDEITARVAELEPGAARERAIRLLAYRDRSESEMRGRLADDGYSTHAVETTVAWLLETGLLDDDRFAEQLTRTLVAGRGWGRTRSLQRLRRAGLSDELALEALDDLAPIGAEHDRALAVARSLHREGDSIERLAARIVRRGYGPADALSAARMVVDAALADSDADGFDL